MATKENIQKLKEKIDCKELVQGFGIEFRGENISCLNPSHPDRNPSMAVYRDRALCFGCGHNLDAIGIVQNLKNLSFQSAIEFLASRYNFHMNDHKVTNSSYMKKNSPYDENYISKNKYVNKTNLSVKDSSIKNLIWQIVEHLEPTKDAIEWLTKRKISVESAWKLGCRDITPVIKEISDLIEHTEHEKLKSNNFINETGGLWSPILNKIKGNNAYSGLIIPIFDLNSSVDSFRWRFFSPVNRNFKSKEITLKVLGQPSCPLMPVGLNFAQSMPEKEELYLCEGEPDWLSLNSLFHENNLKDKFAIGLCAFSLNWSEEWTKIISEFRKIYFCFHDTAKAKKISDMIQSSIFQNCLHEDKKEYWKNNIYEHYFDEKNDINDHLMQNKLKLERIDFKLKEFHDEIEKLDENSHCEVVDIMPMNIMKTCLTPSPELEFVIPGLLRGMVGGVVSAGGTGKSMWAMQTCATIACGIDTLKYRKFIEGKSVFISAEDPEVITGKRLQDFSQLLNPEQLKRLDENFKIYSLLGKNPDIYNPKWSTWIRKICEDTKLVIIDTLRVIHNQDENDGGKMSELIKLLGAISQECNTSIVFLHHTNKNSANNSTGADQQASRGSSVLNANIKFQINLVTMTLVEAKKYGIDENERKFYVKYVYSKGNYGPPIPQGWLKREFGGILKPVALKKNDLVSQVSGGKKNGGL